MFVALFMTVGIKTALVYRERAEAWAFHSSTAPHKGRSQGIESQENIDLILNTSPAWIHFWAWVASWTDLLWFSLWTLVVTGSTSARVIVKTPKLCRVHQLRLSLLTFWMSWVTELVLPHPDCPQHLQPVWTILVICRCDLRLCCCCLSVGQRQGGGVDEAGMGG